jgi:uncharacterized membrane protein
MTTYQKPPVEEDDGGSWSTALALWAGATALFANLAAINLIAWIGDESNIGMQALAALVTALIVAGGVYSKQRYDDEKAKRAWHDNGVDRRQSNG